MSATAPEVDIVAADAVRHELWPIADQAAIDALTAAFEALDALYVADGHHRSAAASRVAAARRTANPGHTGEASYNYFLSVIFPHDQMQILAYNRLVRDLNGHTPAALMERLAGPFAIERSRRPGTA